MSNVQDLIIARFTTLYGDPKTDNIPAFVDEYERSLGHFAGEVLRRAANKVIDDQVFKAWPTPGECRKAAEHVQQMMPKPTPTQAELDKQAEKWPAPSEESKARVRGLMRQCVANIGRQGVNAQLGHAGQQVNNLLGAQGLTAQSKRMVGEGGE